MTTETKTEELGAAAKLMMDKIAQQLTNIDAEFKIIFRGYEWGELATVTEKTRNLIFTVKRGTYSRIYKPFIKRLKRGDEITIDLTSHEFSEYQLRNFRSSMAGYMQDYWVPEHFTVTLDIETKTISVFVTSDPNGEDWK